MSGKKLRKWRIFIHPDVVEKDSKKIDSSQKEFIKKHTIRKLSEDPLKYGEPLRGDYKLYRKLRVGDYRVIYRVVKEKVIVYVVKVGIRRDDTVYKEFFLRLKDG